MGKIEYRYNGEKYKNFYMWEKTIQSPYDYKNKGLIKHILSHKISESKNQFLRIILSYYENSLIFLLKYVDKLKNFKNYHWLNR